MCVQVTLYPPCWFPTTNRGDRGSKGVPQPPAIWELGHGDHFASKAKGTSSILVAPAISMHPKNKEYQKKYSDKIKAFVQNLKRVPCQDCGRNFPACVMDFHHRKGEEKLFGIGARNSMSMEKLLEEISKCDILCANCHRIRTHDTSV